MKKLACLALISFAVWLPGCKSDKIQVIQADKTITNSVPVKAFNDETYIWENWVFSTNSVDKID